MFRVHKKGNYTKKLYKINMIQSYLVVWHKAVFFCVRAFVFELRILKWLIFNEKVNQTWTKMQQYLPEQLQGGYNTKLYKAILTEYRYSNSLEMLLKILPALTLCPWRYIGVCLLLLCLISVFLFKLDSSETWSVNNPPLFERFSCSCYRVPESTSINQDLL